MAKLIDEGTTPSPSGDPESPQQPARRKSAYVPQAEPAHMKRHPSLQVNHYPVLLKNGVEDRPARVIWKTIHDTPPPEALPACPVSPPHIIQSSQCSPSRLLRPSRMSFSTVVNATLKQHQGRCLSSASPMSVTERQQLWDSVMGSSLEHPASASVESLYNSCNDVDSRYRQQRKRRAGISGGSAAIMRGDPFACAGGSGCSSAGIASGRGQLGGRSPQSSFDSNTDVAQISMNWMRMNGLGQGLRPLLTGSPNPPKVGGGDEERETDSGITLLISPFEGRVFEEDECSS